MPTTTPNLGIKKPLGNENVTRQSFNDNWDIIDANAAPRSLVTLRTTENMAFYVDPINGDDTRDGLTSGTALKTVNAAVAKIPRIVDHAVTINRLAGTSSEDIVVSGFSGKGSIIISGGTNLATAANFVVDSVSVERNTCPVTVLGIKAVSTTKDGFAALYCAGNITFRYCICDSASTTMHGLRAAYSPAVFIYDSTISNRNVGIYSTLATVASQNNGGTGNTTGLFAQFAGTIGKNGTQPGGTTSESTSSGGVIR